MYNHFFSTKSYHSIRASKPGVGRLWNGDVENVVQRCSLVIGVKLRSYMVSINGQKGLRWPTCNMCPTHGLHLQSATRSTDHCPVRERGVVRGRGEDRMVPCDRGSQVLSRPPMFSLTAHFYLYHLLLLYHQVRRYRLLQPRPPPHSCHTHKLRRAPPMYKM